MHSPHSVSATSSSHDDRLDEALARILRPYARPDGPGAVLAVFRDGIPLASAASGLASLEHGVALSTTTPIEIASVSKQISATTIIALARDGVVDLDADLRALVPELRFDGITLRHCLQHTSGLPDYLTVGEILGVPIGVIIGYDAFLHDLTATIDLHFPTGTDISYSNTGYVVAAIAAERAAGATFPELVADRVFSPLGMSGSRMRAHFGEVTAGMAFSYEPHPERGFVRVEMGESDAVTGSRHTVGDGEILTTAADFAAWHGFLVDGRVLGADRRDQLVARSRLTDGRETSYGLGLGHTRVGGVDAFGHSGAIWGYRAQSLTDPRTGTGVVVFGNRADLPPGELAWRALRAAIDPVRVDGVWYSDTAVREIEVTVRGDGGVEVSGDDESTGLDRDGSGTWVARSDLGRLELVDDSLVLTDSMGRRVTYVRVAESLPAPSPETVAGTYRPPGRPEAALEIRVGEAGLELVRGTFPPAPMEFLTEHRGVHVYRVEGAVLTVDHSGDQPRITISAGSAVLRDIPRSG